jgi:hypothetical protein
MIYTSGHSGHSNVIYPHTPLTNPNSQSTHLVFLLSRGWEIKVQVLWLCWVSTTTKCEQQFSLLTAVSDWSSSPDRQPTSSPRDSSNLLPLKSTSYAHTSQLTGLRPYFTSLHQKIPVVVSLYSIHFFLCLWKGDSFVLLGFPPALPMEDLSCSLYTGCFIWLTPKYFLSPEKSLLHSDFSWASIPPSSLLSQLNFSKKYYTPNASTSTPPTQC